MPGPGSVDITTQGTVRVATTLAEIGTQLAASAAGDTVQIAAGSYGQLVTSRSIASGNIRIVPASAGAVSLAGVDLSSAQGLDFRGINLSGDAFYSTTLRCWWRGGTSSLTDIGTGHNIRGNCADLVVEDATITNPDCSFFLYADRDSNASNNITIRRCRSENVAQDHVFLGRGTNVVIEDCEFFGHTDTAEHSDGVQIVGGKTVTIRRNHIWNSRTLRDGAADRNDHGVMINYDDQEVGAGSTAGRVPETVVVESNLIHDQTSHGITVAGCLGLVVRNNTVYDNGLNGTEFALSVAPDAGNTISGLELVNNIFSEVAVSGVTPTTNTHNFVADGSGPVGSDQLTGAPGFTNSGSQDYTLAAGSQNIESGTATGAATTDYNGATRPNPPSRGAIEPAASGGGGVTAATVRSVTQIASNSTAALSVALPDGAQSSDLLIAYHAANKGDLASMTAPAAFILDGSTSVASTPPLFAKVYKSTVADAGVGPFSFAAPNAADYHAVILVAVKDADSTTPIMVSSAWGGSTSTASAQDAPSVSPASTDGLLLCGWHSDVFNTAGSNYSPPSGMTEIADVLGPSNYILASMASKALTASGATGVQTATCSRSSIYTSFSMVIAGAPSSASTGSLAGATSAPTAALTGVASTTGSLAATTAAATTALTGTAISEGVLAAVAPTATATATGTSSVAGSLTATAPAAIGSVTGTATTTGDLTATTTPAATVTLAGTATTTGELEVAAPASVGSFAASSSSSGALTGQTAAAAASFAADAVTAGSLSAETAAATASFTGTVEGAATGSLAATAPAVVAAMAGTSTATGSLAATSPAAAALFTTASSPRVATPTAVTTVVDFGTAVAETRFGTATTVDLTPATTSLVLASGSVLHLAESGSVAVTAAAGLVVVEPAAGSVDAPTRFGTVQET